MQRGEEEITELVNAVVDGEATREQQADLQELLRTSPETRAVFEATKDVADKLSGVKSEEPPAEIKLDIMARLRGGQAPSPVLSKSHKNRRRTYFALGWAAAAAFVLAVIIFDRRQPANTGATMAPIVATYRSDSASLVVRRERDLFILEPLPTAHPATVSLTWDPQKLSFVGITGGSDVHSGKAQASFTLREPSQRAGVILRPLPGTGAAEVLVSVNKAEVMRAVLPLR